MQLCEQLCALAAMVRSDKYRTGIITIAPVRTATVNLEQVKMNF